MESYQLYTIQDLMRLKDDPDRWIVQDMIPRVGRTVVFGAGGQYKSLVCFDLCVSVASGGMLMEQFPIQTYGPVVLISTEGNIYDNRDRILSYMRARNVHPTVVKLFYGQKRLRLDQQLGLSTLEAIIRDLHPIMVVLDPFVSFFSGNENSAEDANSFTEGMDRLITEYNLSIIVIHHANKGGNLRGSSALQAWADSVLKFTTQRDVSLPGLRETVSILTVEVSKQRNGREGKLFSVVPFIDSKLGMTSCGFYEDSSYPGVILAHLKHEIYKHLLLNQRAFTSAELALAFQIGKDKVSDALHWLERNGLIDHGGVVQCGSGSGGRTRGVKAWRTYPGASKVDAVRAMIKLIDIEDEDATGRENTG